MIGFLIKKTFFDAWDNLFRLALVNLGFILSAAVPVLLPAALAGVPVLALASMVIGIFWCAVYLGAAALSVKEISDFGSFGFRDFFRNIKAAVPLGLLLGVAAVLVGLFAYVALPFYLGMKSMVGIFAAAVVFWTAVVILLAFQFVPAVRARLDTDLRKVVKKSFIIFFDNPGLGIFAVLHNAAVLFVSFFLAFLAPGPAAMLLFLDEALRLRLYKYDWLEAHPDADRRHIPWEELIAEDREKIGTRSLRNFIFPWKD